MTYLRYLRDCWSVLVKKIFCISFGSCAHFVIRDSHFRAENPAKLHHFWGRTSEAQLIRRCHSLWQRDMIAETMLRN